MRILSTAHGDALLTNAEVMKWLRDIKIEAPESKHVADGHMPPPDNAREIGKEVLEYFSRTPSANQTTDSVKRLYEQLEKYELSDPELLMIANIRPEAYSQLTPLIIDAHNRFTVDTIWEILEVVKTLEPGLKTVQSSNVDEEAPAQEDEMDTSEEVPSKPEIQKEELHIDK